MAKVIPSAGSVYAYAQSSINTYAGFLRSIFYPFKWSITCFRHFFFSAAFPFVPAFAWVLNLLIIVTVIDIMGVKPAAFCTKAAFS
ncbi:hypothetical protein [Peribacillus phoenicis]|uniref:hypothetical protein n=1 Tax=Peribacillus sp. 1P06PA-2 TaxID=3132295 RepID=UPI0039A737FF